jgi:tRNA nucleotidyltransferase (CCA-adding enzyme)
MNTSKLISPLIVVDPVQKSRNASAALSVEKFEAFKKTSKEFVKRPSERFFEEQDLAKLTEKKNSIFLSVKIVPLEGKIDVVGSKLLKAYEFILKEFEKKDFKIIRSSWEMKKDAYFYFSLDKKPLSGTVEIEGPPLSMEEHVKNFRKLHKKTFSKKGKIFAAEKRKFKDPKAFLKSLVSADYVKERSKSTRIQ